jgi:hypothetical protein
VIGEGAGGGEEKEEAGFHFAPKSHFSDPGKELVLRMEKKIDSSGMLEKIRAAGCLTDAELETVATCFAAMDTRQKIDALDERWASDIRKYVQRHTRKGGGVSVSLPTEESGWALTFIGVALICFGVFMLSQLKFETQFEYLPALFFAFIGFLGGGWTVYRSIKARKVVGEYQAELRRFRDARQSLITRLPVELQPARQVCRECLTMITDVHH